MITLKMASTIDPVIRTWYTKFMDRFGSRFSVLPLPAEHNVFIGPGCSALIPHGLYLERSELNLLLVADKDHLVREGLVVNPHRLEISKEDELSTPVFNMSSESIRVLRGEIYSCIQPLEGGQIWHIQSTRG
jgi:hypothetical protein